MKAAPEKPHCRNAAPSCNVALEQFRLIAGERHFGGIFARQLRLAMHPQCMMQVPMADFIELLFVGLLAGIELAVHYGIGAPPVSLSEEAQILLRQALVRRLRILVPAIFLPAFLFAVLVAFQERHAPETWLRGGAIGMFLLWVVIRILRTVPVNSATLDWDPRDPPTDWRSQVERTERFHVIGAWAAVVAFLCALIATYKGW